MELSAINYLYALELDFAGNRPLKGCERILREVRSRKRGGSPKQAGNAERASQSDQPKRSGNQHAEKHCGPKQYASKSGGHSESPEQHCTSWYVDTRLFFGAGGAALTGAHVRTVFGKKRACLVIQLRATGF
jgi:hypothetical protein